jgi:hypothetical protein
MARARLLPLLALLAGACSPATRPAFEPEIVVLAHLRVGEPVAGAAAVTLTATRPVDAPYDPAEAAVRDALVLLAADGAAHPDTLRMLAPGRYGDPALVIAPRTTYRLSVRAGAVTLAAATTTPDSITFLRQPAVAPAAMPYAAIADSFPIVVSGPDPNRILWLDLYCLEPRENAYYVHPLAGHEVPKNEAEYGSPDGPPRHLFALVRLGDLAPTTGGRRVDFYGDLMAFYGRYQVALFAVDDNEYQWLHRDQPERHGGIVGGIGVFGSVSGRTWIVEIVDDRLLVSVATAGPASPPPLVTRHMARLRAWRRGRSIPGVSTSRQ